ncbi:MAG TPA: SPOR domain-containing protein, partial [Sphingomicrobium sp.]|nr:SPOR domain-containing protein [Sphingomicrobium sp.]
SAGEDVDSRLNLPDTTEQPQPKTIPPGETKEPVAPEPPAPKPEPSGAPGSVIQLGAYKNTAQAERAWTVLSGRFGLLSGLTKMVVPYSSGSSSGYRLRAAASSPDAAREACQAIKAGGESCFVAH